MTPGPMQKVSPLHIIFALLALTFVVNFLFIRTSIRNADPVEPSYESESR